MGINLKHYYDTNQIRALIRKNHRQFIKLWREKVGIEPLYLCKGMTISFYNRHEVDGWVEESEVGPGKRFKTLMEFYQWKLKLRFYDIDLDQWQPPCMLRANGIWDRPHYQTLYAVSTATGYPLVTYKHAFGYNFYNVAQVKKYLKDANKETYLNTFRQL